MYISNDDEERTEISQTIDIPFITLTFKNEDEISLTNMTVNHDTKILKKTENTHISMLTDNIIYIFFHIIYNIYFLILCLFMYLIYY